MSLISLIMIRIVGFLFGSALALGLPFLASCMTPARSGQGQTPPLPVSQTATFS